MKTNVLTCKYEEYMTLIWSNVVKKRKPLMKNMANANEEKNSY